MTGYLAGHFKVLPVGSSAILSRFVFVVSLPALIFISLSQVSAGEFFDWPFLGALGGGINCVLCGSAGCALFISRQSDYTWPACVDGHVFEHRLYWLTSSLNSLR